MIKNVVYMSLLVLLVSCDSEKQGGKRANKQIQTKTEVSLSFNSDSAYQFVKRQTEFGPRVPNSVCRLTNRNTGFQVLSCSGTYFQLCSYSNISEASDTEFAEYVTREFGVASIPISVFFKSKRDDKVLRFCFAKEEKELNEAANKLKQVN